MSNEMVPIWRKYALTIQEASKYFGIGEKRLYQIVSEYEGESFILEVGSHVKIKRDLFCQFLDETSAV